MILHLFQFAEQTIIILHVFQLETLISITIRRLRVNYDTLTLHVIDKYEYCHKLAIFKSFIFSQELNSNIKTLLRYNKILSFQTFLLKKITETSKCILTIRISRLQAISTSRPIHPCPSQPAGNFKLLK